MKLRCGSKSRMSFHRKLTAVAVAACIAAAVAASGLADRSTRTDDRTVWTHVGSLRYEVYLPDGYATSGLRYPVIYFLHGLPAGASAYQGFRWLDPAMDAQQRQAILVVPQAASGANTDPEYLGRWETAIASDVPRAVDSRYRTIASRGGRALVGLSAGGYGAFLIGLHHLDAFGAIESWSGYFHPTDPSGTQPLDTGSTSKNRRASAHALLPSVRAALRVYPTFIGFYIGDGDTRFAAENAVLDRELTQAKIPHLYRVYSGGHEQTLWQAEAPGWLGLALAHLERPRA
jgi:enterochelin esterase-like enzyme